MSKLFVFVAAVARLLLYNDIHCIFAHVFLMICCYLNKAEFYSLSNDKNFNLFISKNKTKQNFVEAFEMLKTSK